MIYSAAEASSWSGSQEHAIRSLCRGRVSSVNSGINNVEDDVKRHPEDPVIRFLLFGLTLC